jgi:hypothetical protein
MTLDPHRKPYNDTESLCLAILWAMETYGKCKYPKAVLRPTFLLTPDTREFGGLPGWVLLAKLEGFGDIPVPKEAEKVQVEDLATEPIFTEKWEAKGSIIYSAGEELRKQIAASLEDFLAEKRAEILQAEQAFNVLQSGVDPTELWGEPIQAEARMEAIVENPALAVSPSPVTNRLGPDD